jgi:hypothetical protein
MGCLVSVTGFGVGFWLLIILALASNSGPDVMAVLLVIEALHIFLFAACLKKVRSPEYKAKQKKAQEDWAIQKAAIKERTRQREEKKRRATTVVSTRLIGASAPEYKKSVGDMAVRGAVGSLFGPAGAVIGMATAKEKDVNKRKRRFLVKYEDGHVEEEEVTVNGLLYKLYMEHLEWD